MREMISTWTCLHCDTEIEADTNVVFCDEHCLAEYIEDRKSLETFLVKNLEKELD